VRQNASAGSYFAQGRAAIAAIQKEGFRALTPARNDAIARLLTRFERENVA